MKKRTTRYPDHRHRKHVTMIAGQESKGTEGMTKLNKDFAVVSVAVVSCRCIDNNQHYQDVFSFDLLWSMLPRVGRSGLKGCLFSRLH